MRNRALADWLGRQSARVHRFPISLERSLTVGLVGSLTLLALVVGLVIRRFDSHATMAPAMTSGVAGSILLAACDKRILGEARQQKDLIEGLQRETVDLLALHRLATGISGQSIIVSIIEGSQRLTRAPRIISTG